MLVISKMKIVRLAFSSKMCKQIKNWKRTDFLIIFLVALSARKTKRNSDSAFVYNLIQAQFFTQKK